MEKPATTSLFGPAQSRPRDPSEASLQASKLPNLQASQNLLREILLPYQYDWVNDASRFKIGLWSRQTGKSFATAAEAVIHCLLNPGTLWVVLSAGERQALEWMLKAKSWAEAVKLALAAYNETRADGNALMTRAEIIFANKSRIIAIPANPDTARGYSANLVLDEFAIHEKPWDIWAAIYPSITNPLSGQKKLRIVSTPKGMGNKFADLWHKNDSYSKHKVTIEDAVRLGLPVNLAELRAGVDDPDIWAQEYLCEFIDTTSVLLTYEAITACEVPKLDLSTVPSDAPLYIGMDIGRSKDLSVIEVGAKVNGILHRCREEVLRRKPFNEQLDILCSIASDRRVHRVAIDATGIGAMLAEEARRRLGGKVEGITFTAKTKGEIYAAMRRAFDDKTIRIPADRDLREDLHAVQRNVSSTGTISYRAPRNEDGHSDRSSGIALMLYAASKKGCAFLPTPFNRRSTL